MRDYYVHGAGLEAAEQIRFLAAHDDMAAKSVHLRDAPLYFRSRNIARILAGRLIDFHPWSDWRG